MIRKLLTSAAATALVAGAANALTLENPAAAAADEPLPLAAQLDFDEAGATNGTILVGLAPDNNPLPSGDLVVSISLTGAALSAPIGTDAIIQCSGATTLYSSPGNPCGGAIDSFNASTSTGGGKGDTEVVLLVDGLEVCGLEATGATAGADLDSTCALQLPIVLDGSDVSISVGVETDDNDPVNGSSDANPITIQLYQIEDAFDVDIIPDPTPPVADVNALTGPFTQTFGANVLLGTLQVAANVVEIDGTNRAVSTNILQTVGVAGTDVEDVEVTIAGNFDAFDPDADPDGGFLINGTDMEDIDPADGEAFDNEGLVDFGSGVEAVTIDPDTATPIPASGYTVEIVVEADGTLDTDQTNNGVLGSITRNGTSLVFPWTQSQTQGAASGTTSVFRLGNLDSDATGTVFVEVNNSSEDDFVNPGIIELTDMIPAGGEFVTNSDSLEAELGNYGRGDITFTVEADPVTLTGRQFVVRGDVIQQVKGGNIDEDLD